MVFEQLYDADFLKQKPYYGFLLGVGYTILGLFIALMIFRDDPALIAVGITSLFLIPSLQQLSTSAEINERKTKNVRDFLRIILPNFKVYLFIFFGIFFTFATFSMMLPSLAANHLFQTQLAIVTGQATNFSMALFWDLFAWNLQVLGLCFFLSLIAGNGAIFFITWNASVWGTIFGNLAKTAASQAALNPLILFVLIILSVFPHTFLEGLSYITSTIAGTTLSDGVVRERLISKRMGIILKYNLILLLIGLGILALGMLVETYVLGNFSTYRKIIDIAFPR